MEIFLKFYRFSARFQRPVVFTALGLLLMGSGCVEKKMSVKKAREISVSMEKAVFEPPPRRIGDILDVLDQPGAFDPAVLRQDLDVVDLAAVDAAGFRRQYLALVLLPCPRDGLVLADAAVIALCDQHGGVMKRSGRYRRNGQ